MKKIETPYRELLRPCVFARQKRRVASRGRGRNSYASSSAEKKVVSVSSGMLIQCFQDLYTIFHVPKRRIECGRRTWSPRDLRIVLIKVSIALKYRNFTKAAIPPFSYHFRTRVPTFRFTHNAQDVLIRSCLTN